MVGWPPGEGAQADEADSANALVLRVHPKASPQERRELLEFLSTVVEPPTVSIRDGDNVLDTLAQHCGVARSEDIEALKRLNPKISMPIARLDSTSHATELRLPPCPYWTGPTRTKVSPGAQLGQQTVIQMGYWGPTTREQIESINPGLNADRITAHASVNLPYSIRAVSYELKPQYQHDYSVILEQLDRRFSSIVLSRGVGKGLRLVRPVATPSTAYNCDDSYGANWPLNEDEIRKVLDRNASETGSSRHRAALVVVADTGIEREEGRLPLVSSQGESDDPRQDGDGDGYNGDRVGVNLASNSGFPAADSADGDYQHGTHVAGLATGQAASPPLADALRNRIGLKVVNLKQNDGIRPDPGGGEPEASFSIPLATLEGSLNYSSRVGAEVLNLSVETPDPVPVFRNLLASLPFVVVVAAGNSEGDLDIDGNQVYPASYRKDSPSQLITVAAHDKDGALSSFSNYGAKSVDIAAPGTCIASLLPGGQRGYMSGTSMAAPLVSLTAALLAYEGLRGAAIKRRIMMTVDIDRRLQVAGQGRLNVPNALACYDDQLEVDGRGRLFGRVEGDPVLTIAGKKVALSKIRRLLPHYDDGSPEPMKAFLKTSTWESTEARSPLVDVAISFRPNGSGDPELIALSAVRDFVPLDCRKN